MRDTLSPKEQHSQPKIAAFISSSAPHSKQKQAQLSVELPDWLIETMQPSLVVESSAFCKLISWLDSRMTILSEETIKSRLASRFNDLQHQMRVVMD